MGLKEALEAYLNEQAGKDPAFAEKFKSEKMSECVSYVTSQARKHLQGKNGAVEDSLVYKWARDFYNDGKGTGSDTEPKAEAPKKTWAEAKKEIEEKKSKEKAKKEATEETATQLEFDFS